ncbi:hypothetical protein CDD83_4572 [Cordyceps sp. RAO-2017]|nr:hypothetical protein CDD83_4572 [Cordyceps sp. RAO-2017]
MFGRHGLTDGMKPWPVSDTMNVLPSAPPEPRWLAARSTESVRPPPGRARGPPDVAPGLAVLLLPATAAGCEIRGREARACAMRSSGSRMWRGQKKTLESGRPRVFVFLPTLAQFPSRRVTAKFREAPPLRIRPWAGRWSRRAGRPDKKHRKAAACLDANDPLAA